MRKHLRRQKSTQKIQLEHKIHSCWIEIKKGFYSLRIFIANFKIILCCGSLGIISAGTVQ